MSIQPASSLGTVKRFFRSAVDVTASDRCIKLKRKPDLTAGPSKSGGLTMQMNDNVAVFSLESLSEIAPTVVKILSERVGRLTASLTSEVKRHAAT